MKWPRVPSPKSNVVCSIAPNHVNVWLGGDHGEAWLGGGRTPKEALKAARKSLARIEASLDAVMAEEVERREKARGDDDGK